jgi:phthiocerol/phenolphthiocerol synthesis type-I polyketide synthase C
LRETLRPWLQNILLHLEDAGLATATSSLTWKMHRDRSLPKADSIVRSLVNGHPELASEILIASAFGDCAKKLVAAEAGSTPLISPAVLEFYESAKRTLDIASTALYRLLSPIKGLWPQTATVRVLQIGDAPLAEKLCAESPGPFEITVVEENQLLLDRSKRRLAAFANATVLDARTQMPAGKFDLIVSVHGMHRLPDKIQLSGLREFLTENGLLVAIEPGASLFKDLVFGLDPAWFADSVEGFPVGALQSGKQWLTDLERSAFGTVAGSGVRIGEDINHLIVAEKGAEIITPAIADEAIAKPHRLAVIGDTELNEALRKHTDGEVMIGNPAV